MSVREDNMGCREKVLAGLEFVALIVSCIFIGFSSLGLYLELDSPHSIIVLTLGIVLVVVLFAIFALKLWDLKYTRRLIL